MSRKSPNVPKLVEASRALLDWVYIFGLPGTPESRQTFAGLLNDLDAAAGERVAEKSGLGEGTAP